jgi:hypothetical protein
LKRHAPVGGAGVPSAYLRENLDQECVLVLADT